MNYESKTANFLLLSPYNRTNVDNEIIQALTEDEFFTKCYSEPIWCRTFSIKTANDDIMLEQESSTSETDYNNYIEKLKEKYDYFNNWLNNGEPGLYTISGNAGTGKTTYLYYLKNTIKDKNWYIIDLSHQTSSICWWDEYWTTFDNFDNSYVKLFSNILYYIRAVFFGFRNEELNRQV